MQLGMIGLGRMGANMVVRLMKAGHDCLVYDTHPAAVDDLVGKGAQGRRQPRRIRARSWPSRARSG